MWFWGSKTWYGCPKTGGLNGLSLYTCGVCSEKNCIEVINHPPDSVLGGIKSVVFDEKDDILMTF